VRGDEGTIRAHLRALSRLAPGALELYRVVARRELELAIRRGELDDARAASLRRLLAEGALTVAFIPVLTEVRARQGELAARALVQSVLGATLLALAAGIWSLHALA